MQKSLPSKAGKGGKNTEEYIYKPNTYLSAESASVSSMLGDFHLFYLLTQRGTITLYIMEGSKKRSSREKRHSLSTPPDNTKISIPKTHSTVLSGNADLASAFWLSTPIISLEEPPNMNSATYHFFEGSWGMSLSLHWCTNNARARKRSCCIVIFTWS